MARYKIAMLPGDGIGNDVMEAGKIVLDALALDADFVPAEIGWECWERYGDALPEETIAILGDVDCALFGAITSKPHVPGYRSPIVRMRQLFDLYTNMRPCRAYPGNPLNYRDDIDIVVFRENTEGLYAGIEFHPVPDAIMGAPGMDRYKGEDVAVSLRVFTRKGCRRIVEAAFQYAKRQGRRKVTVVHKANVVRKTCGMFLEEAQKVAQQYPGLEWEDANVDAMAMWLIKNPRNYEVIVTSNLFGDIISDECAQLVGGLGFAAAGNIGETLAVFEPTHGSAPKYAGMYKVNPMAMLLSVKMMLDWLEEKRHASRLEAAIAKVVEDGVHRTYDMGGSSTTLQVAEAVAREI
jgi:3-isopropylmalate dehydrogenase